MNLTLLYRGPLASCNYGCGYCPFSKRLETTRQLDRDRAALDRFGEWVTSQSAHAWRILFTPWGEALVRNWYRECLVDLSQLPHVLSVGAQTNLSTNPRWLKNCRTDRVTLWATYHPTETTLGAFIHHVNDVLEYGARISVGAVAVPEHLEQIESLRQALPPQVTLWINAQQPRRRPYTATELLRFEELDPQFTLTTRRHPSFGAMCPAGETSFTVDGEGNLRRCHFVDDVIGNIYDTNWVQALQPRACPNRFCNCFLGLSQLLENSLLPIYGTAPLERMMAVESSPLPRPRCPDGGNQMSN